MIDDISGYESVVELPKNFDERKAYLIKEGFLISDALIRCTTHQSMLAVFQFNDKYYTVMSYPGSTSIKSDESFIIYKADHNSGLRGVTVPKSLVRQLQIDKLIDG
jgi:hypothetical protein